MLGIALLHTGISLADTMVMAAAGRRRDLTALRPAGATRAQLLRLTAAEALTVVSLGGLLGLLVRLSTSPGCGARCTSTAPRRRSSCRGRPSPGRQQRILERGDRLRALESSREADFGAGRAEPVVAACAAIAVAAALTPAAVTLRTRRRTRQSPVGSKPTGLSAAWT
ncbi:FtsX-like permease family protein [Streptomyces sp. NPDC000345]|uniref:FtsX-like permease family protein n=1 Tax=Streptomyces sp. NPDC000345 TaxID=3364537 RepID=UPI0036C71270